MEKGEETISAGITTGSLVTGSLVIDKLLERGYEKDVITTIYGPAGSGKTTLCMLVAIAATKNKKKVIFVDTEGGFSAARFEQIIGDDSSVTDVLKNIFILKPTTFNEQGKTIERLRGMINEQIGLVIVDTIGMLYRVEVGKKENIRDVNNELSVQLSYLTEITRKHNIPVILSNQVYSDFDERDNVKIVGGDLLKYASKCLIELQKVKVHSGVRKAVVKKHRSLPEGKCVVFRIVEKGLEEIKEED